MKRRHTHMDSIEHKYTKDKVLMLASVASMIDQFNMPNIHLMQQMGYEVHVVCNFIEGNTCDEARIHKLQQTLHQMHVVQHQWDCPRDVYSIQKCYLAYRQLHKLMACHHFAWMHCHSPIGGALARIAAHQYSIRIVYTAHGFHFYQGAPLKNWLIYYPVEKMLAHYTEMLITLNKEDYRLAKKSLKAGKICYIPGVGIDVRRFQEIHSEDMRTLVRRDVRRKYGIPQNALLLLSVGELSRRKNHQAVIRALAGLGRKDIYYLICGQGSCREQLMQSARRLGVSVYLRLTGYQEDVASLYQAADVFVFPSLQEGMPVALMEAMASGMPCVVSQIRGNRELIDQNGGQKFPPMQTARIMECLEEMLSDKELRHQCGCYNRRKIQNYTIDMVSVRMKKIYAEMAQKPITATPKHNASDLFTATPKHNASDISAAMPKHNTSDISAAMPRHKVTGAAAVTAMYESSDVSVTADGKTPAVSVIMPVYNMPDEQILRKAVDSIRGQTFADWELVICDDGSTNDTWDMLLRTADNDPRIRLIRHAKNYRAGHARNTCIHASRGRYIAVMDADDISSADRLDIQYRYLEEHPELSFAGSRGEFFTNKIGDDGELYWYSDKPKAEDFLFSLPYVHGSIMFRREALLHVHGYDGSRHAVRAEDYDLLLRMCAAGLEGCSLPDVLYYIRRDRAQYGRRKYRYRFHEAYVKYRGFRQLGLMPKGILYAAKPLVVGLMPVRITAWMQRRYYQSLHAQPSLHNK